MVCDSPRIFSAAIPAARIEFGRTVPERGAELPARSLGLGPFSTETLGDGRARLRDASGQSWGVFSNPQLAAQTAAALSAR